MYVPITLHRSFCVNLNRAQRHAAAYPAVFRRLRPLVHVHQSHLQAHPAGQSAALDDEVTVLLGRGRDVIPRFSEFVFLEGPVLLAVVVNFDLKNAQVPL
jgi:hypothetical protein